MCTLPYFNPYITMKILKCVVEKYSNHKKDFFVEFSHSLKVFIAFENFKIIIIAQICNQREPKGVQILCEWPLRLTL